MSRLIKIVSSPVALQGMCFPVEHGKRWDEQIDQNSKFTSGLARNVLPVITVCCLRNAVGRRAEEVENVKQIANSWTEFHVLMRCISMMWPITYIVN
jgi:hypothetical protein